MRKARELGRRTLRLALTAPHMVNPRANYARRDHDGILVLQRGENASVDYYLRPRLEASGLPWWIADLDDAPSACAALGAGGPKALLVVICRYASGPWLEALEAVSRRLSRVAFFMDDDLPAVMRDAGLPQAARGKTALHYGAHVDRIGALASEVWVSTWALAERYPEARATVLEPLPEADPPAPAPAACRKVVYHGTDAHRPERRFVLEVARRLAAAGVETQFEITGDSALARAAVGLPGVSVTPQLAWPDYLKRQTGAQAAISLAPLMASTVNAARAPVKAFDAARLGAAGVYADYGPYPGFVRDGRDGLLLPMEVDAWVAVIAALLAEPDRRIALALGARKRLLALRRARPTLLARPAG